MTVKARCFLAWAVIATVVCTALGLWFCTSTSQIKVARAFTSEDVEAIRRVVTQRRWAEVRKSIAARDFRRVWSYALPVLTSRSRVSLGFPALRAVRTFIVADCSQTLNVGLWYLTAQMGGHVTRLVSWMRQP